LDETEKNFHLFRIIPDNLAFIRTMVNFASMEYALGTPPLNEVYRSSEGCVYQCEKSCRIILEFQNDVVSFKIPCFFAFKRQVEKIDLQSMLLNPSKSADIEILKPCGCDKIFVLSLREVAELKSLMEGTKVMFDLNRILNDRLCSACR
jgi:hypothetical protein